VKYLGLLKADNLVPVTEIESIPPDKLLMLVTGAQGEEFAALMRMANKSHKYVQLRKNDKIVRLFSFYPVLNLPLKNLQKTLFHRDTPWNFLSTLSFPKNNFQLYYLKLF
jgi:ribonuclease J